MGPDPLPAPVAELSGRYRIQRLIGRGGAASVHLAHDVRHARQVAIKVMAEEVGSAHDRARFRREIGIVARLNHPHLVPLFDSGVAGGRPYYVMPYIPGGSLRARLTAETQLPLDDALRLAGEIASGLSHAHRAGLVHRDVKPENVLLADGIALVSDFGVARWQKPAPALDPAQVTPTTLTEAGGIIGTPAYMAPEQILGGEIDQRADLYALACVVYEMLAGRPPFVAETRAELLWMQLSSTAAPVTESRSTIPAGVAEVLARALAKTPADRYPTAARFAEALFAGARARDRVAPTPRTAQTPVTPHNLPHVRTRFIGRHDELAECGTLLDNVRLLTITGIGGCGKTRLALRVAQESLAKHGDGVWFADLASIREADRVTLVVSAALSMALTRGESVTEQILGVLANRTALVVLDNCEHVLDGARALVEALLDGCPRVRVLATSREPLGMPGEQVFQLHPLPIPAGDELRDAIDSDAVRLFRDRAHSIDSDFGVTEENVAAVVEICRRLDGIPLALELAAARTRVLSVAEIRDKLDDRFRLLTDGPRGVQRRHQTLAAALDWSHDLLAPDEQRMFRCLSVFVGGCTLQAVAAVAGDDADEFATLACLSRLADKSVIDVGHLRDGSTRYLMLETVRQFALTKLEQSGESPGVRDRHLDHYLAFAEEADEHIRGPEAGRWLTRLDRERENVLAAHVWCDSAPDGAQKGLRLQAAMRNYWRNLNLLELGLRLAEAALARPGAEAPTRPRADLLSRMSLLCIGLGRHEEALACASESVTICRQLDDPQLLVFALLHLGAASGVMQDHDAALRSTEEAIPIAERLGDKLLLSALLNNLGELRRIRGELDLAELAYDRALACCREIGRVDGVATDLTNTCYVLIPRGRLQDARSRMLEALRLCRDHDLKQRALTSLDLVLALAAASGDAAFAAELWGGMEAARNQSRTHRDPHDETFVQGWRERARTLLGPESSVRAEARGRERDLDDMLTASLAWLEAAQNA